MRIIDIRETVVPIKSAIRNAFIDFSQMTVSVLAIVTDVVRDGKPVVGFGFQFQRTLRAKRPLARSIHPTTSRRRCPSAAQ